MNRIDRLIEQAKRQLGGNLFPTVAMITHNCDGRFALSVHLWGGVDNSGEKVIQTEYASMAAARAAYAETCRRYPVNKKCPPVVINLCPRGCE